MSGRTLSIFWVVVIVILIIGGLVGWWNASRTSAPSPATETSSGTTATSGSSDQAIDQSMTSIDTQMQGLSSDSATVDQGLSDTPVTQQAL